MAASRKHIDLDPVHARIVGSYPKSKSDPRPYWRAVVYREGREHKVWNGRGTYDEVRALLLGKVQRGELDADEKPAAGPVVSLGDMLDRWVGGLREELGERDGTFIAYRTRARALKRTIGTVHLTRITSSTMADYVARRAGEARSTTITNELVAFGVAWRWAYEVELVTDERPPIARQTKRRRRGRMRHAIEVGEAVPVPVASDKRPKYTPTVEEIGLVLDQLEGWRRIAFAIMCTTGARIGEVGNLLWRDVDLDGRVIHIADVAGNKTGERWTPIGKDLAAELRAWRESPREVRGKPAQTEARPTDPVLGVTLQTARGFSTRTLAAACEAAGVPYFSSHGLRRHVADAYGDAHVDGDTVTRALGNTAAERSKSYRTPKIEVMAEAQERVGPRLPTKADVLQFRKRRKAKG